MDSSEKCAFASIGEAPIDSEAVERIAESFDDRYAKYPAFDKCADLLEKVFAHYDPRSFTDDLAQKWTTRLSMTAGATECRGILLVALYNRLVYKQSTRVADIDYSFILKYLLWMTVYIKARMSFESPNKVRTLFDEAISLYEKLSSEKKREVASIDNIYDLSTSGNIAKEYLAFRLLDAQGSAALTSVDLSGFRPTENRFYSRAIFESTLRGVFEFTIKKAFSDGAEKSQVSDMPMQSSDESRSLRLLNTAKAINDAIALAHDMQHTIQGLSELFVMDIARSVMEKEPLSPADADVLFREIQSYAMVGWKNIDQSWRNAKAMAAIESLERFRYDPEVLVTLSNLKEIWKNVPDSRLHEIMADKDLRLYAPWSVKRKIQRRSESGESYK